MKIKGLKSAAGDAQRAIKWGRGYSIMYDLSDGEVWTDHFTGPNHWLAYHSKYIKKLDLMDKIPTMENIKKAIEDLKKEVVKMLVKMLVKWEIITDLKHALEYVEPYIKELVQELNKRKIDYFSYRVLTAYPYGLNIDELEDFLLERIDKIKEEETEGDYKKRFFTLKFQRKIDYFSQLDDLFISDAKKALAAMTWKEISSLEEELKYYFKEGTKLSRLEGIIIEHLEEIRNRDEEED